MWSNCASRSGCFEPSSALRLYWREKPSFTSSLRTVSAPIGCPNMVGSKLDERGRRMFAAGEVRTAGRGGLAVVSRITGLARSTINRDDLDGEELPKGQVRRAGAGRKAVAARDPGLVPALK